MFFYYFRGFKGSSFVKCPKGKHCNDNCGENFWLNSSDQSSNKCKNFEPSELSRKARETFKFEKVDWICHLGHIIKGCRLKARLSLAKSVIKPLKKGWGISRRHTVPQKTQKMAKSPKNLFEFLSNLNIFSGLQLAPGH